MGLDVDCLHEVCPLAFSRQQSAFSFSFNRSDCSEISVLLGPYPTRQLAHNHITIDTEVSGTTRLA